MVPALLPTGPGTHGLAELERLTAERLPEASPSLMALWAFATRAGRLMEAFLRDVVAEEGLDVSEFTIIGALWFQDRPYRSTVSQLAEVVALSQPGISRALQRGERNGNLRKLSVAGDRRTVMVELTAQGHARADRAIREVLHRLELRLGPLDESTSREIAASALKLAHALRD